MTKEKTMKKVTKRKGIAKKTRKRITILSMILGASLIGGGLIVENMHAHAIESQQMEETQKIDNIVVEGTGKTIGEVVKPFMNKQFSNSGETKDEKNVTFFGNAHVGYTAVQIVFNIKDNKAKILSITADSKKIDNIDKLYELNK